MSERGMPTLSDVAALAGVSKVSASVALNGSKSGTVLSEATRERIVQAAHQLGYLRNSSMATASAGRFGCVALLLSTKPNVSTLPRIVLEGIHDELAKHNIHLTLFRVPDEELTNPQWMPKIMREWMADGIIVDYTHEVPTRLSEHIEKNQLPAVWFNTMRDYDCVRPDDYGAGRELTQRMIAMGHKRLLYIDHTPHMEPGQKHLWHYSYFDRLRGYEDEMKAHGLQPRTCLGRISPLTGQKDDLFIFHLREAMQTELPSAIVSNEDYCLQAAYAVAVEMELKVPDTLSIASFNSTLNLSCLAIEQTLMGQQEVVMGRELVKTLLQKIEFPTRKVATRVVPFQFVDGASAVPTLPCI